MIFWYSMAFAGLLVTGTSLVQASPECEHLANEKRLSKAAKASFVRKCVGDQAGDPLALCERAAAQRNLRGAARNTDIKRCINRHAAR